MPVFYRDVMLHTERNTMFWLYQGYESINGMETVYLYSNDSTFVGLIYIYI